MNINKMTFEEISAAWNEMIVEYDNKDDLIYDNHFFDICDSGLDTFIDDIREYLGKDCKIDSSYDGITIKSPRKLKDVRAAFKKALKEHEELYGTEAEKQAEEEYQQYLYLKKKFENK